MGQIEWLWGHCNATIIDVMEWMINTQLGRCNLPPQQRIAVVKKFEKKIQEQAKENMSIGGSSDKKGSPNGETLIENKIHTDKELAKMAGVGTGTIARFNDLETNIRQRGIGNTNQRKMGLCIKELDRIYDIRKIVTMKKVIIELVSQIILLTKHQKQKMNY